MFYVPIALSCYWWARKGILVATFLSGMLILSNVVITGDIPFFDILRSTMFIFVSIFITFLKEACDKGKKNLKVIEERYHALFQNSMDAVWYTDVEGVIVDSNEATANLLRCPLDNLIGRNILDFYVDPTDRSRFQEEVEKKGSIKEYEVKLKDNYGKAITCLFTSSLWRDDKNNIKGYRGIVHDITDRKKAEDDAKKRAKEMNCLYDIAKINETPNITLDQLLQKVVERIPYGWKYPEIACSRIKFEGQEFKSINFTETMWKQEAQIKGHEKNAGTLEVFYLEKMPDLDEGPFLTEERNLILAIAERLSRIIERAYSEQALKESENTLQSLFAAAPVGICLLKGRVFQWVNTKMADILGYAEEELIGQNTRMLYDTEEEYERLGKILYPKTSADIYTSAGSRLKRKDGTIIDCFTSLSPLDPLDHSKGFITTLMDISDKKKAEKELIDSEEKYRELVENANSIISKSDKDGRIISMNEFGLKFFGYSKEELIGKLWIETVLPKVESSGRVLENLTSEILNDINKYGINLNENIKKNGERVWIYWANKPIYDKMGELEGFLSVGTDITDKKKSEKQLAENLEYFAHLVDHIRNPLAILSAFVQVKVEDEKTKEVVIRQVDRIEELIKQLDQGWMDTDETRKFLKRYT